MRFAVPLMLLMVAGCSSQVPKTADSRTGAHPKPISFSRGQIAQNRMEAQLTARLRKHLGMKVDEAYGTSTMPNGALAAARLAKAHPELALGESTVLGALPASPKDQTR